MRPDDSEDSGPPAQLPAAGPAGEAREADGAADPVARLAQVCDALAALHNRGLCHGALQPEHVIVDAGGAPRLQGFGPPAPAGGQLVGDPSGGLRYAPPEHFETSPVDPFRADVYAVGVMLFEQLCGQQAFTTPPGPAALRRTQLEQVKRETAFLDPGPGRPDALRQAVRRLTAADPAIRVATASAAAALLHAIHEGRAAPAEPPRKPSWLLVLGSGLMLLIAAMAAILVVVAGVTTPPKAPAPGVAPTDDTQAAEVRLDPGVVHVVLTDRDGRARDAGALPPGRYALRAAQLAGGDVLRMDMGFDVRAGQVATLRCDAAARTCALE